MRHRPDALMLFAAGFGTRMGALAADRPKPLVAVAGRPLIDHALTLADAAGVARKVVNLHYRGELLASHLEARDDVALAWEREAILETGGGLRAALPLLGDGPVLTLNPDVVWTGANPLTQLLDTWDAERMDALLMVLPAGAAGRAGGKSDFVMDGAGRLSRAAGQDGVVYLGAQIIRTEGLSDIHEQVFSLNLLWDRMISAGRAFGLLHAGGWCDVGTPAGVAQAEALLADV